MITRLHATARILHWNHRSFENNSISQKAYVDTNTYSPGIFTFFKSFIFFLSLYLSFSTAISFSFNTWNQTKIHLFCLSVWVRKQLLFMFTQMLGFGSLFAIVDVRPVLLYKQRKRNRIIKKKKIKINL